MKKILNFISSIPRSGGGIIPLLFLVSILSIFSACSNPYDYPLFPPVNHDKNWTVVIVNTPLESGKSEAYTLNRVSSFTLPNQIDSDEYKFDRYMTEDGDYLLPGDMIEYEGNDNVVIYAEWLDLISFSSTENLSDIIAEGKDVAIDFPAGEFGSGDTISVLPGQRIYLNGADGSTTLKSFFTLAEESSLRIENLSMEPGTEGNIISSSTGNVDIEIDNSKMIPTGDSSGIMIDIPALDTTSGNANISISNTEIVLSPATNSYGSANSYGMARGISIGPKDYRESGSHGYLESLNLDIDNLTISTTTEHSAIGVFVSRANQFDINIKDSRIETGNIHYPVFINHSGNNDSESYIEITDSHLEGYGTFYIAGGSKKVHAVINDSTLKAINTNFDNGYNDFSVISMHDSENSTIEVDNSDFIFGKASSDSAHMKVFCFQYNKGCSALNGGSQFIFRNCDFDYQGTWEDGKDFGAIDILVNPSGNKNSYSLDAYSLNSLLANLPGSHIGTYIDDNYSVDDKITIDWNVYYLTTEAE